MKLFVIAGLIAVAAAGRLEHLERSYLPPDSNAAGSSSFGSHGSFGSNSGAPGSFGSHGANTGSFGGHSGSFGGNSGSFGGHSGSFGGHSGSFGSAGASQPSLNSGAFPGATSNQYLPPNQRGSASSNVPQFGSASQGLGGQNFGAQSSRPQGASQQYSIPSTQYGIPAGPSSFTQSRSQPQSQFGAASRQYLAPKTASTQNIPQQAFDEETGYHY